MEIVRKTKSALPLLWKIWATLAIVILFGAIIDINTIIYLLSKAEFSEKPGLIFFNFIRFIVCGLGLYGLYLLRKRLTINNDDSKLSIAIQFGKLKTNEYFPSPNIKRKIITWRIVFLLIIILFNPLLPFPFHRNIWLIVDICTSIIFICSYFLLKMPVTIILCDNCGTVLKEYDFYGGYYKNFNTDVNGDFIGNELCYWCVKELIESEELEIKDRDPLIIKDQK